MSKTQTLESEHNCPLCGATLREVWKCRRDGSSVSGLAWERVGDPVCPEGHSPKWTAAGTTT